MCESGIVANGLSAICRAVELEWGDADASRALGSFELILAADCIYETDVVQLLVQTIVALLHPPGSVLLAYDEAIGRAAAAAAFRSACDAASLAWEELDAAMHDDDADEQSKLAPHLKSSVRLVRLVWSRPSNT